MLLVVPALVLGNAAFEMGYAPGAAPGLESLTGLPHRLWCAVVGLAAFGAAVIVAVAGLGGFQVLSAIGALD